MYFMCEIDQEQLGTSRTSIPQMEVQHYSLELLKPQDSAMMETLLGLTQALLNKEILFFRAKKTTKQQKTRAIMW